MVEQNTIFLKTFWTREIRIRVVLTARKKEMQRTRTNSARKKRNVAQEKASVSEGISTPVTRVKSKKKDPEPKYHADDERNVGVRRGITYDGVPFSIPKTTNTITAFYPQNLSIFSGFSLTMVLLAIYLTFTNSLSRTQSVLIFFFWRVSYNIGLGMLLRWQSVHSSFTKWFQYLTRNKNSKLASFTYWIAKCGFPRANNPNPRDYPAAFNAWVIFKNLVTIILVNDGVCYILLGYQFFEYPSEFTWKVYLQYFIGLILALVNYSAKKDAHRCIGTYCWYYGDFFFRKEQKLTFDGIFDLFPHPMYTVGYSLYYGYSLICQSYNLLFISLAAHMMQLSFLILVEEPHIKRIYGNSTAPMDKKTHELLYDASTGLFPLKQDSIFFYRLNLFNFSDLALVICSIYCGLFCYLVDDPKWCVAQVIIWRTFHWLGLGGILFAQSRAETYTRWFTSKGRPLYEAFHNWKGLYNFSITINAVAFVGCAIRYFEIDTLNWDMIYDARLMASFLLGAILILLNLLVLSWAYSDTGEFSWYYGDFFIRNELVVEQKRLCYSGIYRFLNNPESVAGYVGYYGCALICQSWVIFGLAVLSQFLNLVFVRVVEMPHMRRIYDEVREVGGFSRGISKVVNDKLNFVPSPMKKKQKLGEQTMKKRIREVQLHALRDIYELYVKIARDKRELQKKIPDTNLIKLKAPEIHMIGTVLDIEYKCPAREGKLDWIGILSADMESGPGRADGKWRFVPKNTTSGVISFPVHLQPTVEGVYEVRYHLAESYQVVASSVLIISNSEPKEE